MPSGPLSPAEARQIDRACDRFEAAWQAGEPPRPEDHLGAVGEPVRSALLRQLLLLDWDYRRRAGGHPDAGDYLTRFPDDATLVDEVRREMTEPPASTHERSRWSSVAEFGAAGSDVTEPGDGGGTGLGRYDLLREVGHGGIGVVYRGRDRHLGRDLAVKVLREAYREKPEARRRFIAEARVGSQLQHPAIVPVYEQGLLDDRRPYFTMKLVEGHTLAALLRDRAGSEQDLPRFLGVFEQVCQAMAYAHARGVVHRDLKPANVMVGAFGEVQVMDWGFAKRLRLEEDDGPSCDSSSIGAGESANGAGVSQSGVMMGTPAYMPPEQAQGESGQIGPQADVFALGAMLCEILTGRSPYAGGSGDEIWRRAADGDLGDAFARLADCKADEALRELARRCLAADRGRRPADAEVVARELTTYLASAQERLREAQLERAAAESKAKAERRARRWILALAVALMCGTGVAVWQAALAHQSKDDALAAQKEAVAAAAAETEAKREALAAAAAQTEAKKTADAKEAETRAVLDFVQKRILVAARPAGQAGGLGREVTLRRALEVALPDVDRNFAKQPLTEARVRATLGESFLHLGELKIAAEQFERQRAICTEQLGPNAPETLGSMTNLSVSYYALGQYADAAQLREQVLAAQQATLGPDHPDTLRAMGNLANSYTALGRHADALPLHERALTLFQSKLGPDHLDTLTCLNNLANSYYCLGRYAEALRLREDVLARRRAKLGPDHPDTLLAMYNLAISYADLGRNAEALKLREETVARQQAKLGPDHPATLSTMDHLATSYAAVGRYADALKLSEQVLAKWRARFGPDNVRTLGAMQHVANHYYHLGRHAEALKLCEDVVARRQAKLGADHPDTLKSMTNLATSYAAVGRYADAQKLIEQTLALERSKLGPDHPSTLLSMGNLANTYADLGRHADARQLQEQVLARQKALLGSEHPDTLRSMNNLANTYAALGRHADALRLREETLARRKSQLGPDHPDTLWSLVNLARSYAALGRRTEAIRLREEALPLMKAKFGPDHPETLQCLHNFALADYALGRYADALKLHEETLALRKVKLGPDHPKTLNSMWGLAETLVKLDRGADAVPILDECLRRAVGKSVDANFWGVAALRLQHFQKAKDAAGCRATAEMWEKLQRVDADSLNAAACFRAVTAAMIRATDTSPTAAEQADAEADRAMAWLKKAVAAGFKDIGQMTKDADLDALRDRDDFRKLMAELKAAEPRAAGGGQK